MMEKFVKKLNEIKDLLKAGLMPSLRMPSIEPPKPPKAPSLAPKSKKNPVKVAQQVQAPQAKDFAMGQAVMQVKANTNPLAFATKSEGESYHYHILQNGQRITDTPVSMQEINIKHGGVKRLENAGFRLVPVVKEKLKLEKNGQWSIVKE
jgi:hypothetical protein